MTCRSGKVLTLASLLSSCGNTAEVGDVQRAREQPDSFQCTETTTAPYWVVEGQTLQIRPPDDVQLEPLPEGAGFVWKNLPEGVRIEEGMATLSWTPRLDQAAMYEMTLGSTHSEACTTIRIGVIDNFADPDNVSVVDPSRYPEEYGIPVLFLEPGPLQNLSNKEYIPSTITLAGQTYSAEAKNRGATSLEYPVGKRSYTLKFDKDHLLSESLLGANFVNRRKLTVTTTFDDNSYLRQRLAYELWNRMSPEHLTIEASHVVVFANGEYEGLFFLTDHVDRHLMGNHGLSEDGNLYKARYHEANFGGDIEGYTKEEGQPLEDLSDLVALMDFVTNSDASKFAEELSTWLLVSDFVDWNVFVRLIGAGDSGAKNSYLYHERPNALWRYLPWDLNMSFGQDWQTYRDGGFADYIPTPLPTDKNTFARVNRLMERMLEDSQFSTAIDAAFERALLGAFSVEEMHEAVDHIAAEIEPSARRDWSKWREKYHHYEAWFERRDSEDNWTDYDGEVQFVKDWIEERHEFLSSTLGQVSP